MLNIFNIFKKNKTLDDLLSETKDVKIHGVVFKIRRISVIDHLEGARVLYEIYSTYKTAKDKELNAKEAIDNYTKAKKHYTDIIMAGVVSPKLSREISNDGIFIDKIFNDWDLAKTLGDQILFYTFGKKK